MIQDYQFEQPDQQSTGPKQGLVQVSAPASRSRSSLPTTTQLARIFSAAMCSLMMALFFLFLSQSETVNAIVVTQSLLTQAGQVILGGSMLSLGLILCVGIPLAVVAWRGTPHIRFLLTIPFLAVLLPMFILIFFHGGFVGITAVLVNIALAIVVWRATPPPRINFLFLMPFLAIAALLFFPYLDWLLRMLFPPFGFGLPGHLLGAVLSYPIPFIGNVANLLFYSFIYGTPILCTRAIGRAIQQATIPDKWLRFARVPSLLVVFGLVVMFLGVFFWGLYLAIFVPAMFFSLLSPLTNFWNSWLLILIGMLVSVIVAARALSSQQ
jgi:hypothetical protein